MAAIGGHALLLLAGSIPGGLGGWPPKACVARTQTNRMRRKVPRM